MATTGVFVGLGFSSMSVVFESGWSWCLVAESCGCWGFFRDVMLSSIMRCGRAGLRVGGKLYLGVVGVYCVC